MFLLVVDRNTADIYARTSRDHCTNDTALGLLGVKSHHSRHLFLKEGPALNLHQGYSKWCHLNRTGFEKLKRDTYLSLSPSYVSWYSKEFWHSTFYGYGSGGNRVLVITRLSSVPSVCLAIQSFKWVWVGHGTENIGEIETRTSGFSNDGGRASSSLCFWHHQVVLSRRVGISEFSSFNDSVELLQPCSWLT